MPGGSAVGLSATDAYGIASAGDVQRYTFHQKFPSSDWVGPIYVPQLDGRGRDEDCSSPPAQIPASAANAPGSSLGSVIVR
jgi:hypothetical protein